MKTYRVFLLEDLGSDHVPHAVPNEGDGGRQRSLGTTSDVRGDQCPGQKHAYDAGYRHEVAGTNHPWR